MAQNVLTSYVYGTKHAIFDITNLSYDHKLSINLRKIRLISDGFLAALPSINTGFQINPDGRINPNFIVSPSLNNGQNHMETSKYVNFPFDRLPRFYVFLFYFNKLIYIFFFIFII